MIFTDEKGNDVDVTQFDPDSLVICRVAKAMTHREYMDFCKANADLAQEFGDRGISLIFCPDWVEFKEWK